ncbi:hypothetical protein GWI33_011356 [Rhynchophorus ferrugineus]|uniref:Ig-like domain-containing protein n=1 Tax=Rhynchophorus ferrugineus TaxID=354439 RepID=A0A834MDA5_RHYFE|nr:hypothetical protein GWI33_011356 [Rhynchophorus ferrugineus]
MIVPFGFLTCFVVILAAQPVMEFGPKNLTVLDGQDATMTCRAAGAPVPNVTWIFNGKYQHCNTHTRHLIGTF